MKKLLLSTALCASMLMAESDYNYEITPMLGGAFTEGNLNLDQNYANGGLSLGFNQDYKYLDQVEIGILRTLEDVDYKNTNKNTGITRFFVNFVKDYELTESTSLYALVGPGIEIFDNEEFTQENGLFGNYGVGIKYKLYEDIALKFDLRHVIEADHGDNTLLYNFGLAIPFGKKAEEVVVVEEEIIILDSDGDGVPDGTDRCPNTPAGAVVDQYGCEFDTDMDGVVNSLDQCPNTPKGDIVDEKGCSLKVDLNINFDFNSAVINNSYDSKIKKFADFMNAFPSVKAKISAHTDSTGPEKYNQKLSDKRAESASKALQAYGVDAQRIDAKGYGESDPIASNDTREGRAENRRVEGTIQK